MKILLNNIELILRNEVLDVSSANPFLENDEDRLDNIFSVEIPIVGNERALGYIDNIDVVQENEYSCEIISSISFLGVAIVTEVSTEENKAILQIGYAKSNFNYLIKDRKMKELDFGSIECSKRLIFSAETPMSIVSSTDTATLVKPTLRYYQSSPGFIQNNMLYFPEAAEIKLNIQGAFANTDGVGNNTITRVNLYYKKNNGTSELIRTIDSTGGETTLISASLNITGNVGDTIEIIIGIIHTAAYYGPTMSLYFLCTINKMSFIESINADEDSYYCFPMLQNNNMMNQLPEGLTKTFYDEIMPLMNNVYTGDKGLNLIYNNYSYTKLLAPCFKVEYILDKIFESIGYILDKEKFKLIYNKLIVFTGNIIAEYNANNEFFYLDIPEKYNLSDSFNNDILFSDFLKDMYIVTGFFPIFNHEARSVKLISIADLYKEVINIECIVVNDTINYDYEKKGITIEIDNGEDNYLKEKYNDLEDYNYRGEIATLTDVANDIRLNDCYYITSERKYYAYSYGKPTEDSTINRLFWKFVSHDFRLKKEDGKEEFVSFKSDTPIMVGVTTSMLGDGTSAYQNINIPVTEQPIKIKDAYDTYNNKFSSSFLINRGKKTKNGLGEYTYASADNFFGQTQSNEISLRVDGEYGIANRMYKTISEIYKNGKKHTINGYMTAAEIQKLSYKNLIYINKGVNILLSYGYKLTDNDMKEIELELIKI